MRTFKEPDVEISGDGEPVIVAIHGIQGTRGSWKPVAASLAKEARWVLPNLRGRAGAWRGGSGDYTLEGFAEDVVRVIDEHAAGRPYVLAGWSMGVSVALATYARLAARGTPLPQALILMSGSPVLAQTRWFEASDFEGLLQEIAARELRLGLQDAADRDAVAWTWQAIRHTDQRPLLAGINVPTLIVHGSADEDSPWDHARLLLQGLPQAQLSTIAGGPHSILSRHTECVAGDIRAFLSSLTPARSLHENQ